MFTPGGALGYTAPDPPPGPALMTQRNYLFIHQNMPAQFMHLCLYLRDRGHKVFFITKNKVNRLAGVTNVIYAPKREPSARKCIPTCPPPRRACSTGRAFSAPS